MSSEGTEPMDDLLQEMIRPAGPTVLERARRRRLVASAATIGIAVVGVTSLTTSALFSDNDDAGVNGFTTGSVSIDATPDSVSITTDPLVAPGDTTWFELSVTNDGSLAQRYAVRYAATSANSDSAPDGRAAPDLAAQVELSMYATPAEGTCDAASAGATNTISHLPTMVSGAQQNLIGSTVDGQQLGDRLLASNASEKLCGSLHVPTTLTNDFTDSSVAVSFTFYAEQTANNP